jgi:HEAT repeat protein
MNVLKSNIINGLISNEGAMGDKSMLNGRTVSAILLIIGAVLFGTSLAQEQTLEQNWNDFLHYTTIGRLDLAKGYAQAIVKSNPEPVALLALNQANPQGYDLAMRVVETSRDAELAGLTKQLVAIIDRGRFERRSDPMVIVEEIKRLGTTLRGKMTAIQRLKDAGEYAVPFMLDAMANPARTADANLIEALPQIGRPAIRPLVAALQTDNVAVKTEIIKALGKIGYTQSLAHLRYITEKDPSAPIRELAGQSIRLIDPKALDVSAATLFFQLAEKYYYHDESLAPQEGAPIANVWFWDKKAGRLVRSEVNRAYFHELMTMRCCEWALKADESYGQAIGLWLAAFFVAQGSGVAMPEYFDENHANAMVYATTAGPEYLHQALARALKDKNAVVALGAVEALAMNAGEKSLMYAMGSTQPLLQALAFPNKAVRYTAAITIGNAGPRQPFNESRLVVQNLAQALGETDVAVEPNTPQTEAWTSEMANSYARRAAATLLKIATSRNPAIDLSLAQPALINATKDSRPKIQLMAIQALAYLSSPDAQRAIASLALNGDADSSVRIAAFQCLADSAKMNGNLLADSSVSAIYTLISSNETQAELRAAAAGAYGALNLPSQQVRTLILDQAKS